LALNLDTLNKVVCQRVSAVTQALPEMDDTAMLSRDYDSRRIERR
jgi:hypothetical protein